MKLALINCTILDGSLEMQPRKNMTVFIENGMITGIREDAKPEGGWQTEDMEGRFVMPGLINMHVHLPASGKPKKKQTDAAKTARLVMSTALTRRAAYLMCRGYAKIQLLSGVTTVRTVGGVSNFDSRIRDEFASGAAVGPRLIVSNMAVSVPGGHMAGSLAYEAKSADEAAMYVRKIADTKPDLIKLMITGGVIDAQRRGEPGVLRMPPEYIRAACDEAHKLGFKVAAHVESTEGIKAALENGVDTVEHGAPLDAYLTGLFKEHGSALICTLSPAFPYAIFDRSVTGISEDIQFNGKVVLDGIIEGTKTALAEGVPVGLGTDTGCPYTTQYDMWRELVWFTKFVGVSNAFALHTATLANARILGLADRIGSIEVGKCADMIVSDQNPLDDLSALRELRYVIYGGKVIKDPKIRKMKKVENELDKWL